MSQSAQEIEDLIRVSFTSTEPTVGEITISDQFRTSQNHPAGIRAPHAIEAMKEAMGVDRWDLGGSSVSIAIAAATETRPYAALVTAGETPTMGGNTSISQAWRLYGDWPDQPTSALAAFIARFGLEIIVGGSVRGLFVPTFTGNAEQIIGLAGDPRPFTMSAQVQRDGSNGPLHVWWAYAIDDENYRTYVGQNR